MAKSKSAGSREQILDAADALFGEVGFDAASTREIAERCGLNKALIHYHFQSKEALFTAVLDRYYERLNQLLLADLGREGSPREILRRLIGGYVDFLAANRDFSRIVQRESAGGAHMDRINSNLLPAFQAATGLLTTSFPATRAGEMDALNLMVSFYGMIVGYFTYAGIIELLSGRDPLSGRQLKRRKQHLFRMLDAVLGELETGSSKPRAGGKMVTGKMSVPRVTGKMPVPLVGRKP
jgi:TetR/AcrR family transcriptional regulator